MPTVLVTILKKPLSRYLARLKHGAVLSVTSLRQPIAKILPSVGVTDNIIAPTRPVKDLLKISGVKKRRTASAVESLLVDRQRR